VTTRREFTQGSVVALIMTLLASIPIEDDQEQAEELKASGIPQQI
jgi:hypothetical protein